MFDSLFRLKRLFLSLLLAAAFLVPAAARADDAQVQTAWRLLDYMSVDYRGAVRPDGSIISPSEFAEMREFSASVAQRIAALPANPQRAALVTEARQFAAAVAAHVPPDEIERRAHGLAGRLLGAYPVPLAPQQVPDLVRGARLYAENCAACHGATGLADTATARQLDPHPIAFADRDRARHRSLFGLYQVISQGLEGTPMQSWSQLPTQDRWALAFYVGRFAYPDELAKDGADLWRGDPSLHSRIPNIETLAGLTPDALAQQIGEQRANALIAFLRASPGVVMHREGAQSLAVSRDLLAQSLTAYRQGDRDHAGELALAAYLDGFEPVEAVLNARDASIVARVEAGMGALRSAIHDGAPVADVERRNAEMQSLFDEAERALQPEAGGGTSTFVGALAILLREGLEALLIVVAMITFLIRAERRDLLRWVHIGWVGALVAGFATWWAATTFITISGAGRELTEGFGSLLAAAILLFVGIWMHGKAQAGAWQAYVKDKLDKALSHGSNWFLFTPRLHRRLSRGVRDDHLLRRFGRAGRRAGAGRRHRRRFRPARPGRLGDAALQREAADRQILRLQLGSDRGAGGGAGRQGLRGAAGIGDDRGDAARRLPAHPGARHLPDGADAERAGGDDPAARPRLFRPAPPPGSSRRDCLTVLARGPAWPMPSPGI